MNKNAKLVTKSTLYFLLTVFVGCFLYFMTAVIVFVLEYPNYEEFDLSHQKDIPISSMKDGNVFVVGRNTASESQNFYYLEEKDGKFYSKYKSAEESALVETTGKPHIKVFLKIPKEHSNAHKWSEGVLNETVQQYFYEFHVPKGSIEMEFEANQE